MAAKDLIPSLELIRAEDSGLNNFNRSKFSQELSFIIEQDKLRAATEQSNRIKIAPYLHLFIFSKHEELADLLQRDPSIIAIGELKALKILNMLILGKEITLKDLFPFAKNKESVLPFSSRNLSKHIVNLYSQIFLNAQVANLEKLPLAKLEEFLDDIALEYSSFILRYKIAAKYSEVWEILSPYALEFSAFDLSSNSNKQVFTAKNLEAIRLLGIYKRLQGDLLGAEHYEFLYHKYFSPDTERRAHLISHANTQGFPSAEILTNWGSILQECDEIQEAIHKQAGLESSTCEYFSCTDCCKYTFPVMSYTEFLYLKNWLVANNYPLGELEQRCAEIQSQYESQYGERFKVLDKNLPENNIRGIENPHNFKYTCPFLDNAGRCSCYAARPLLCRGFGLSTDNGISTKSCQYFIKQYDHGANADADRDVYDLRQVQALARASDRHLSASNSVAESLSTPGEKVLSGTIVAWFSPN